eukprot:11424068-Alexandrium_andersonii.AAC.1
MPSGGASELDTCHAMTLVPSSMGRHARRTIVRTCERAGGWGQSHAGARPAPTARSAGACAPDPHLE